MIANRVFSQGLGPGRTVCQPCRCCGRRKPCQGRTSGADRAGKRHQGNCQPALAASAQTRPMAPSAAHRPGRELLLGRLKVSGRANMAAAVSMDQNGCSVVHWVRDVVSAVALRMSCLTTSTVECDWVKHATRSTEPSSNAAAGGKWPGPALRQHSHGCRAGPSKAPGGP